MEEKSSRLLELVNSARQSLSVGDNASVGEFADLLLNEFPKSEKGWLILASISEPDVALGHLENALRINPDSQAARQAIRLITTQILDGTQVQTEVPNILELEDTQSIKIKDENPNNINSAAEQKISNSTDLETEIRETNTREDVLVHSDEVFSEIESSAEIMEDVSSVEEIPAFHPDLPVTLGINENIDVEKQERVARFEISITEKEIHIKETKSEPIEKIQIEPIVFAPMKINKLDQKIPTKHFNVEIFELFLIAGVAVLLPLLVFAFFYLTR